MPILFAYWQLVVKGEEKILSRAANIIGLVLVGGSLALIRQLYNLESNMMAFLWTWTLLTTPFVFVFKEKENVIFSALMIISTLLFPTFKFLVDSGMDEDVMFTFGTIAILFYSYLLYLTGVGLGYLSSWASSGRLLKIGGFGLASIILFATTFEWYAETITDSGDWEAISIALNIFFIGFLVFALIRTIKFEAYSFIFTIVRFFLLYLLVKYFTLFYSMFDTGLFFIIGGLLFIAGGWLLEKKKSLLIDYIKAKPIFMSKNKTHLTLCGSYDHLSACYRWLNLSPREHPSSRRYNHFGNQTSRH